MLFLALTHLYALLAQFCNTQQDFSPDIFFPSPLKNGVLSNGTLCPQFWVWFSISTTTVANYTRLEQQGAEWVERKVSESVINAVSVSVDAGYDDLRYRFHTLAVLVVNGTTWEGLPADPGAVDPYSPAAYIDTLHVWAPYTDRETATIGFNDTAGATCQEHIGPEVFIGVQCVSPLGCGPLAPRPAALAPAPRRALSRLPGAAGRTRASMR